MLLYLNLVYAKLYVAVQSELLKMKSASQKSPGRSEFKFSKRKGNETDFIDVINKLQDKLTATDELLELSLPQIVVEGGESSGKSSVLESIIGRDFLPRGTGTVTRRPTIIQSQPSDEVYAEFLHRGNEKFTDFERVKQEILDETMKHPGPKGFSSKPICLKIYAPNVLKLTFVDMCGLIKFGTPDMEKECAEDVERMTLEYIGQPNCIILAVTPANQELKTSDAIQMASRVDPKRERTLCVLTKLDLMDRGTDAKDILENQVLPMAKGYIGVVNRSQEDILEGKDIESSLMSEKRFFENHPAYSYMADRQGSAYLQKRLQLELIEHIRKTLPSVRKDLSHKLSCVRKDLKKMEQMLGCERGVVGSQAFMMRLVHQFIDDMQTNLFGHNEYVSLDCLGAGAIINFKLHEYLQEILKLPADLTEEKLIPLITNVHGTRNILSTPSVALEAACGSILENYREPLETFVDSISSILLSAVEKSCILVKEFPALKEELVRFVNESIDEASEETKDLLGKYLDSQKKFCNVYHWDFKYDRVDRGRFGKGPRLDNGIISEIRWLASLFQLEKGPYVEKYSRWKDGFPCCPVKVWGSGENAENHAISAENPTGDLVSHSKFIEEKMKNNDNMKSNSKNLAGIVTEYIRLVQKQIADTSLKHINCFLVHQVSDFIKKELIIKLLDSSKKDSFLGECEEQFERRNQLIDLCANLEEALVAVQAF